MRIFRTVQNIWLSLWQSAVRENFGTEGESGEIEDATADYCETVFELASENSNLSLNDLLGQLESGDPRGWRRISALHHFLGMAQEDGDHELEVEVQEKIGRAWPGFKNFEEGKRNAWQWSKCVADYKAYQRRTKNGPMYRSPVFNGNLMEDFSVIHMDHLIPHNEVPRIALFGDWGTGEKEAKQVVEAMLNMANPPHILIHLGDIYFSGTKPECWNHFYKIIKSQKRQLPVFTLPGNHDYYSGGEGFYTLIDHLNTGLARQQASYFCLRNKGWQILAMDTGIMDSDPRPWIKLMKSIKSLGKSRHMTSIQKDELLWHKHQLENANANRRKTILLSHHQLFSAYEPIGAAKKGSDSVNTNLQECFKEYFYLAKYRKTRVDAWFWGHEHDFVQMKPGHQDLAFDLCIGHGAIPVNSDRHPRPGNPPPYSGIMPNPLARNLSSVNQYYRHGFSVMMLPTQGKGTIEHFEVDDKAKAVSLGLAYSF